MNVASPLLLLCVEQLGISEDVAMREERTKAIRGYRTICVALLDQIERRHLVPGDRIPSEADLMSRFKVSKMTAARARQELSMRGSIKAVPGVGSFVSAEPAFVKSKPR
jgi:DNA-binding GntR family transcriptional regulator